MGLAVVEDLAAKGWNITVFDFDHVSGAKVAERLGRQVHFIKGNTAKYEELGAAFAETRKNWGSIDFVFANAGIGERSKFYEPKEELAEGFPAKPSTLTLEVNLLGVVYTAYLAMHFFRKNATKGGKLVMTSSASALYPSASLSLYSAAKHAVVGLTRSMGAALVKEGITVNCICPGIVPSGLLPEAFTNALQADMITPTSTIVKAINNFLADDSLTGQVAECSGQDVIYRPPYEPENEAARYMLALQDGKVGAKIDFVEMGKHAKMKKEFYDRMEDSAT
ncbi:hypothetical protein A1O7_03436 [Cladophialophora yegresii CBS 114405]|uniref:Uncharacterized protein n=1 Tax=Cladophialophora yegresii CBS 114405 TaxID=1182544 RepID=W9W4I7_9EURO|nr:uncharacterized protein A1O7_03436 [Cladophialophora yegresii CBS 114405]EXJ62992.1 hypothetical protein A1O7_03436 [Cladophialophora yegresii CBS 114405]